MKLCTPMCVLALFSYKTDLTGVVIHLLHCYPTDGSCRRKVLSHSVCLCVCLFSCTICSKKMQIGSPNLTQKYS